MAFRTQLRIRSHGPVVGEASVACAARLAAFAASVESCFQVSPAMSEFRGLLMFFAGGASVRPRFRGAVVAHPAAFGGVPQVVVLQRLVAATARAKEILLL